MFKLRNIITLGVILVAGLLVYNRYLGTPEEQEQAKSTFQTIGKAGKDIGKAVGGLLKSEKEKFDEGKYGDVLDKIGTTFQQLGDKAKQMSGKTSDYTAELDALQKEKAGIEAKITKFSQKEMTDAESVAANEELVRQLGNLSERIDATIKAMEKDAQ